MASVGTAATIGWLLLGMAASAPSGAQAPPAAGQSVFFLADPQLHNVHGTPLKQMTITANRIAKVAIRPAELNLLAPLVLRHAVETGSAGLAPSQPMVVLGDATNIGCSGEWDEFAEAMNEAGGGRPWLVAHGNHDSYMMGTINSYMPVAEDAEDLTEMLGSAVPTNHSWWKPRRQPAVSGRSLRYRNWADACHEPAQAGRGAGVPMNKVQWLARYTQELGHHGLSLVPGGSDGEGGWLLESRVDPGKALAAMDFRLQGIWYKPEARPELKMRRRDYQVASKSFIVQSFSAGPAHAVVLLDTSVCLEARGGGKYVSTNAGTQACLGPKQLGVVRTMLDKIDAGRHVVFAGHFPLKSLSKGDREALIGIMQSRSPGGWSYVSAHSHDRRSTSWYAGGRDVNIGSTTDWPMESHVLRIMDGSSHVVAGASTVLGDTVQPLAYVAGENAGAYSELCRHLPVAELLAGKEGGEGLAQWQSPAIGKKACDGMQRDWAAAAGRLVEAQAEIARKFRDSEDYRQFVLRVASGASLHEFETRDAAGRFSVLVK